MENKAIAQKCILLINSWLREYKIKSTLSILIVGLLAAGCTSTHIVDPHNHVVDVHTKPFSAANVPNARMVRVDPPPNDRLRNIVTNQAATMRAYIVDKAWIGESTREHIQIQYLDSGKVFEIEGIPLEYRPFSDLVWVDNRYLVFDRWSQPHYGMHYVVDTLNKKLILSTPFSDQI